METTDVPVQNPETAARLIDDAMYVLHGETSELHALNDVGARIWDLADGSRSVAEIAETVEAEYEVEADRALADVLEFLAALAEKQLVAVK